MEPSVRLTTKPAGPGDRIAHARLEADGALIFASDGHPKYPAKVGENISVALSGTDKALRAAEPQAKLMPITASGGIYVCSAWMVMAS